MSNFREDNQRCFMPDSFGMGLICGEVVRAMLSPLIVVMILMSLRKNVCDLEAPLLLYLPRDLTRAMSREFFGRAPAGQIRHLWHSQPSLLFPLLPAPGEHATILLLVLVSTNLVISAEIQCHRCCDAQVRFRSECGTTGALSKRCSNAKPDQNLNPRKHRVRQWGSDFSLDLIADQSRQTIQVHGK
jgi:hypothetical protein